MSRPDPMEILDIFLGVVGAGDANTEICEIAVEVGKEAARRGWVVVTGGLGGVMEAAARGARQEGGVTLGILPGSRREDANPYIQYAVATNMAHARNAIIAHTADAMIAVDGEYGTLSEVAFALKLGKPVVGIRVAWSVPGLVEAVTAKEAIEKIADLLKTATATRSRCANLESNVKT